MGRRSKLTPDEWAEIQRRILAGETPARLAEEYGIGRSTLSEKLTERIRQQKAAANQLAAAEKVVRSFPISEQLNIRDLASEMIELSSHLIGAAKHGARTAHRLAILANSHVDRIDETQDLAANADAIKSLAAMQELSNKAAQTGINLIAANKDAVRRAESQAPTSYSTPDELAALAAEVEERI